MATNTLKTRFKHAYKTESEWSSSNPVLYAGEVAYSSDKNNKYKIGNGTSTWSELPYAIPVTKSDIGLGNVENKSSATIRGELTKANVTTALTYTPATTSTATQSANGLLSSTDKAKLDGIATGANKYTHPTSSGNKHIPSGGASGQILRWSADGTAVWGADNNTTYGVATSSALGLVKSGTDITVDSSGNVSVNDDSHNHVISNVDGLQSALNGKAATGHTHDDRYYTESEIDSKLSGKANSSHGTHVPSTCTTITDWNSATTTGWYMGSNVSNAPSNAWYFGYVIAHNTNYVVQEVYQFTASTDAKAIPKYIRAKMNGTWGSWTEVTVQKKVPSDAKFTDTWRGIQDNLTSTSTTDSLSANQGKVLKGLVDGKAPSSHTHNYAGSSSAGGSATSAVKLDSSAGSATQPVYFSSGKPVACTYTLGKSVPSNAVFTDTWRGIQNNLTSDSTSDSLSAAQGKALKTLIDGSTISQSDIDAIFV